jgi:hypothetical protein
MLSSLSRENRPRELKKQKDRKRKGRFELSLMVGVSILLLFGLYEADGFFCVV